LQFFFKKLHTEKGRIYAYLCIYYAARIQSRYMICWTLR